MIIFVNDIVSSKYFWYRGDSLTYQFVVFGHVLIIKRIAIGYAIPIYEEHQNNDQKIYCFIIHLKSPLLFWGNLFAKVASIFELSLEQYFSLTASIDIGRVMSCLAVKS